MIKTALGTSTLLLALSLGHCNSNAVCPRGMEVGLAAGAPACICKPGLVPDPTGSTGCLQPPGPSPSPSPVPTIEPSLPPGPSPTPQPSPTPTPQPSAPPCVVEPIPGGPVPLAQPAGACSGGASRYPYELGGSICVAESACVPRPGAGDKCPIAGGECITAEAWINYHARWGRIRLNQFGLASYYDGPQELAQADAYGRVYQAGIAPVRPFGTWDWTGNWRAVPICPPKRSTCPPSVPPPSTPPSVPPGPSPTPVPNPGPTPAACPALVCIHAQVHLAAGPGGLLPSPTACDGCRVVLDATPLFSVCLARGRCNAEMDTYCHGRLCEDARGYVWHRIAGPATAWNIQEPGPERGYQALINTPVPGTYSFEVCAGQPLDTPGFPVVIGGPECNPISFEVR